MKIYIGADHAGFGLKEKLVKYLTDLGYEVSDQGALTLDQNDDYPDFVRPVALAVIKEKDSFGIVIGASGQGEAMCANRVKGIRCATYYGRTGTQIDQSGHELDMVASMRLHNDANMISLGARFIGEDEAKQIVKKFLETNFSNEERHIRRINKLDQF